MLKNSIVRHPLAKFMDTSLEGDKLNISVTLGKLEGKRGKGEPTEMMLCITW